MVASLDHSYVPLALAFREMSEFQLGHSHWIGTVVGHPILQLWRGQRTCDFRRYFHDDVGWRSSRVAQTPYQMGKSEPGVPASAMLGTSGIGRERLFVLIPSAIRSPLRIAGSTVGIGASTQSVVCPATVLADERLKGT